MLVNLRLSSTFELHNERNYLGIIVKLNAPVNVFALSRFHVQRTDSIKITFIYGKDPAVTLFLSNCRQYNYSHIEDNAGRRSSIRSQMGDPHLHKDCAGSTDKHRERPLCVISRTVSECTNRQRLLQIINEVVDLMQRVIL